jgi:hypothetical protein
MFGLVVGIPGSMGLAGEREKEEKGMWRTLGLS